MELLFLLFLPCICWKMKFHKTAFSSEPLSLGKTNALKGALAVFIVLHHLAQQAEGGVFQLILGNIGVLCVSLFLFFSGYGLQKSNGCKTNYPMTLLRRRIPSVMLQYLVLILIYWGLGWIVGAPVSALDVLRSLGNGRPVVRYSWYTICILVFYVNYFMSTMLPISSKRGAVLYHCLSAVLWVSICRALHYEEYWYNAAIAFPMGIFWAEYEETITPWLHKHYLSALIFSFAIFGMFYSAALLAMKVDVFVSLYWIACIGFLLFVVLILMKFTFQNPLLRFLGQISFELYGIHGFFMILYRSGLCRVESDLLWSAAVMGSSVAAAWVLHGFFRWLLKKLLH